MIVVADSTPLIALARIGRLKLLKSLYGELIIPDAVFDEVVHSGKDRAGVTQVQKAEWIKRQSVDNEVAVQLLRERLDRGESEAIILALELEADLLLIDEMKGRRIAEAQGIAVTGTVGAIVAAKRQNVIDSVQPLLDDLRHNEFRLSDELYKIALAMADEENQDN
ncbi:MAG: DUF3368 domain-containing protein [Caldilineaceae bacterium]|nr:DUF3368 domain-containing protein [Caldilineaceae bacterium]MCB0098733.1 DUF3368 domain-containing protein [Caldilineaceae bacterium]